MHITIENNTVVVNLDETEFPLFEAMFANLQLDKQVAVEFRKFPNIGGNMSWKLLPMHLCRTIGEANLSEDPFATVSLYPFWKYGFAFGDGKPLALALGIEDPHKKAVSADEFGMGFTAWAMEEIFHCESWADATAMIKAGLVVPTGAKCPDFVCTFPDGSLGIFEAKGTTGTASALTQSLKEGKYQAFALDAQSPIKHRVVVGTALGEPVTKVILMDPPPSDPEPVEGHGDHDNNNDDEAPVGAHGRAPLRTNLTADLVRAAAMKMRASIRRTPTQPSVGSLSRPKGRIETPTTTIFRGPTRAGTTREIALTNELKPEKNHSWLDIG